MPGNERGRSLRELERSAEELLKSLPASVIGGRLRRARESQKLSVRDLAEAAALSKTSIVRLEKGEEVRPITILKVCEALGLHVERLARLDDDAIAVHRHEDDRWFDMAEFGAGPIGGQDRPLSASERAAYVEQGVRAPLLMLHSRLASGRLLPSILELYEKSEPRSHPGEEFVFVLRGAAIIGVAGKDYALESGESMDFWGTERHTYAPAGPTPALVLSVRINP